MSWIVALLSGIASALSIVNNLTSLMKGEETRNYIDKNLNRIERLGNGLYYAPYLSTFQGNEITVDENFKQKKQAAALLTPLQQALDDIILASSIVITPEKLSKKLTFNPAAVLDAITLLTEVKPHSNPNMSPLVFSHHNIYYVGWQMRDVLPILFNCEIIQPEFLKGNYAAHRCNQGYIDEFIDDFCLAINEGAFDYDKSEAFYQSALHIMNKLARKNSIKSCKSESVWPQQFQSKVGYYGEFSNKMPNGIGFVMVSFRTWNSRLSEWSATSSRYFFGEFSLGKAKGICAFLLSDANILTGQFNQENEMTDEIRYIDSMSRRVIFYETFTDGKKTSAFAQRIPPLLSTAIYECTSTYLYSFGYGNQWEIVGE